MLGWTFHSGSLCQEFAVDPDDALFTVTVTVTVTDAGRRVPLQGCPGRQSHIDVGRPRLMSAGDPLDSFRDPGRSPLR